MKEKRIRTHPPLSPPNHHPESSKPKKPKKEDPQDVQLLHDEEEEAVVAAEAEEDDEEMMLVALVDHRTKEVQNLRQRLAYYTSQLEEADKKLQDSENRLARLRHPDGKSVVKRKIPSEPEERNGTRRVKVIEPIINQRHPSKSKNAIPSSPNHNFSSQDSQASISNARRASPQASKGAAVPVIQGKCSMRKLEQVEHQDLIPLICSSSSPCTFRCHTTTQISSQHKRKLRSVVLCPVNDNLFATSALDGLVNLWEIQAKGSGASLLSTTECVSPSQRRWPEDIAWHPHGNSIVCAYSADGGDSQISIVNLNKSDRRARVSFLEDKPHVKGIINSIEFLPWEDNCFITGGSDHAVTIWNSTDDMNSWKSKPLHRNLHSSAVTGVAGMLQKDVVLSSGADKRILAFDIQARRAIFQHQMEHKCMSVLPNPCDFNLFMVHTGAPESQLRLFDIRLRRTELHAFGWKQESSESQSALINQSWSPDGLYVTSGSADPMIHIFDIRYIEKKSSQSVKVHQKRVFKAVWHRTLPLLISISSDLNIGMHKIT